MIRRTADMHPQPTDARRAGISTRHTCPSCAKPRCFTLYVDDNNEPLGPACGKCDHESSCGYHYLP